jgi:hypothetical protein
MPLKSGPPQRSPFEREIPLSAPYMLRGYYGPYVPSSYFVPPNWLLPPPGYGAPGP